MVAARALMVLRLYQSPDEGYIEDISSRFDETTNLISSKQEASIPSTFGLTATEVTISRHIGEYGGQARLVPRTGSTPDQ